MPGPNTRTRLLWRNGKKVRAHRWLMEQHLGRTLLPTEHVHHRDGNPLNNEMSNLEVMTAKDHMRLHKQKTVWVRRCMACGRFFTPTGRKRHTKKCCSSRCAQRVRVTAALKARRIMEQVR